MKYTIVISGINMVDGGALSILKECLRYLDINLSPDYKLIALVHSRKLFSEENLKHIEFKEFKDSKSSWFKRINYEYFYFHNLSKEINPYLWLSLHDMTPNVQAKVRAVYCHNPAPFYKPKNSTLHLEPKLLLFKVFYKYLYKINIKKNDFVIVQQNWLKEEFESLFSPKKVLVAYPEVSVRTTTVAVEKEPADYQPSKNTVFFYPSFPRIFKNFEVLFEASKLLQEQGVRNFIVKVTIKGDENKYAKYLFNKYKADPCIEWCGMMSREEVFETYVKTDCLIFSSKLETWGLPITEFRSYSKPMLLADLPYARETAAGYSQKRFFNPDDTITLAQLMADASNHRLHFETCRKASHKNVQANGWGELFNILLSENGKGI